MLELTLFFYNTFHVYTRCIHLKGRIYMGKTYRSEPDYHKNYFAYNSLCHPY